QLTMGLAMPNGYVAPANSLADDNLANLYPADIDAQCPATAIQSQQYGHYVTYALPKFLTLKKQFEKVVYDSATDQVCDTSGVNCIPAHNQGDPVILGIDDGTGNLVPHQLYLGYAIACSNLAVRPLFLGPVISGSTIVPFEHYLDYLCLM